MIDNNKKVEVCINCNKTSSSCTCNNKKIVERPMIVTKGK